jgi:hypothetical protein
MRVAICREETSKAKRQYSYGRRPIVSIIEPDGSCCQRKRVQGGADGARAHPPLDRSVHLIRVANAGLSGSKVQGLAGSEHPPTYPAAQLQGLGSNPAARNQTTMARRVTGYAGEPDFSMCVTLRPSLSDFSTRPGRCECFNNSFRRRGGGPLPPNRSGLGRRSRGAPAVAWIPVVHIFSPPMRQATMPERHADRAQHSSPRGSHPPTVGPGQPEVGSW